jgi:hypothetical protein
MSGSLDQRSPTACVLACVCVCVCDLETSIMRQPRPDLGCSATETIGGTNNSVGVCVLLDPNKVTKEKN